MKGHPKIRNPKFKNRGAAIMLALWALFLLAAMVISWALDIDSRFTLSANANRRVEAVAMACSGAEVALHPMVKAGSPNLRRQLGGRRSYEARITGEGGRLNINWTVTTAAASNVTDCEQDPKLKILCRYLTNKGIELTDRSVMIDSLLDWVSPGGGLHRLNAPPESENYHPAHALFARLDDLKKVNGWEEFTSAPDWDEDFTVNSIPGTIDLTSASRDVLRALTDLPEAAVDRFLELRRGQDGIDGTSDDLQFRSPQEALAALGLTRPEQIRDLLPLVAVNSQVYRIVSVGKSGDVQRTVRLVVQKTGNPQVITWKEY